MGGWMGFSLNPLALDGPISLFQYLTRCQLETKTAFCQHLITLESNLTTHLEINL